MYHKTPAGKESRTQSFYCIAKRRVCRLLFNHKEYGRVVPRASQDPITAMCCDPVRRLLYVATGIAVQVWNAISGSMVLSVDVIPPAECRAGNRVYCLSLDTVGGQLYAAYGREKVAVYNAGSMMLRTVVNVGVEVRGIQTTFYSCERNSLHMQKQFSILSLIGDLPRLLGSGKKVATTANKVEGDNNTEVIPEEEVSSGSAKEEGAASIDVISENILAPVPKKFPFSAASDSVRVKLAAHHGPTDTLVCIESLVASGGGVHALTSWQRTPSDSFVRVDVCYPFGEEKFQSKLLAQIVQIFPSPVSNSLLLADTRNMLYLFRIDKGTNKLHFQAKWVHRQRSNNEGSPPTCVAFNPNHPRICVVGDEAGVLRWYDIGDALHRPVPDEVQKHNDEEGDGEMSPTTKQRLASQPQLLKTSFVQLTETESDSEEEQQQQQGEDINMSREARRELLAQKRERAQAKRERRQKYLATLPPIHEKGKRWIPSVEREILKQRAAEKAARRAAGILNSDDEFDAEGDMIPSEVTDSSELFSHQEAKPVTQAEQHHEKNTVSASTSHIASRAESRRPAPMTALVSQSAGVFDSVMCEACDAQLDPVTYARREVTMANSCKYPNGLPVAIANQPPSAEIWQVQEISAHVEPVTGVVFFESAATGPRLLSCGLDGRIVVWDTWGNKTAELANRQRLTDRPPPPPPFQSTGGKGPFLACAIPHELKQCACSVTDHDELMLIGQQAGMGLSSKSFINNPSASFRLASSMFSNSALYSPAVAQSKQLAKMQQKNAGNVDVFSNMKPCNDVLMEPSLLGQSPLVPMEADKVDDDSPSGFALTQSAIRPVSVSIALPTPDDETEDDATQQGGTTGVRKARKRKQKSLLKKSSASSSVTPSVVEPKSASPKQPAATFITSAHGEDDEMEEDSSLVLRNDHLSTVEPPERTLEALQLSHETVVTLYKEWVVGEEMRLKLMPKSDFFAKTKMLQNIYEANAVDVVNQLLGSDDAFYQHVVERLAPNAKRMEKLKRKLEKAQKREQEKKRYRQPGEERNDLEYVSSDSEPSDEEERLRRLLSPRQRGEKPRVSSPGVAKRAERPTERLQMPQSQRERMVRQDRALDVTKAIFDYKVELRQTAKLTAEQKEEKNKTIEGMPRDDFIKSVRAASLRAAREELARQNLVTKAREQLRREQAELRDCRPLSPIADPIMPERHQLRQQGGAGSRRPLPRYGQALTPPPRSVGRLVPLNRQQDEQPQLDFYGLATSAQMNARR